MEWQPDAPAAAAAAAAPADTAARLHILMQRRRAAEAEGQGAGGSGGGGGGDHQRPAELLTVEPQQRAAAASLPPELLRRLQQLRGRGPEQPSPPQQQQPPHEAAEGAGRAAAAPGAGLEAGPSAPAAECAELVGRAASPLETPEAYLERLRELLTQHAADAAGCGRAGADAEVHSDGGDGGVCGAAEDDRRASPGGVAARLQQLRGRRQEGRESAEGDASPAAARGDAAAGAAGASAADASPRSMSVDNDGAPAGGGPAAADTTADTAATRGSGPLLARVLALASRGLQQGEWRECCERAAAAARLDPSSKVRPAKGLGPPASAAPLRLLC
jgi:hypothetical protein